MKNETPAWHGLMYSTGILLCLLGMPAIIVSAVLLWLTGDMTQSQAAGFGGVMLGIVVPLAIGLWLGAAPISRWRQDSDG